ncbi:MAG: NAD-dependent epimerase/dehydratase family protein [bacterium]|nr:NAD-dependent epimerase/dehydratase family protein [bacterium]
MLAKPKILITGVAGFVGSNFALRLIKEGYHVIGIDNLAYGVIEQVPPKVDFHKLDIRSPEIYSVFEGIDFVFHLAAKNCLPDCQDDPIETSDINVTGTVNVFEAAKRAGVKKIINAESSSIYEGTTQFPTPETESAPKSMYGASKVCAGIFAKRYQETYNLNCTTLRYYGIYGPRQDYRRLIPPVMSAFIIKLLKDEPPTIYGTGEQKKDFIYIDDINDFHLLCLTDKRTDNEVFNLGGGRNFSILELYKIISELLGTDIKPIHKPPLLDMDPPANLGDITKAKSLGWSPKVDLKTGLEHMIEYIKGEIKKGNIK